MIILIKSRIFYSIIKMWKRYWIFISVDCNKIYNSSEQLQYINMRASYFFFDFQFYSRKDKHSTHWLFFIEKKAEWMHRPIFCDEQEKLLSSKETTYFALKTNISSGNKRLSHINSYFCVKSAILNLKRVKLEKRTNKEYRRQSQRNNRIGNERMTMNDNEW